MNNINPINQILIALHQNNNRNHLFNFENILNQSLDQQLNDTPPDKPVSDEFFNQLHMNQEIMKMKYYQIIIL